MFNTETSNPLMKKMDKSMDSSQFDGLMTWGGIFKKTAMITIITFATMLFMLSNFEIDKLYPISLGAGIIGFIVALITIFKPNTAKFTSIPYALLQGVFISGISLYAEQMYPGIILQAIIGTAVLFFTVLTLYAKGILRATPLFRKVMILSMVGIFGIYLVNILLNVFTSMSIPFVHEGGFIGIGFSLFVVVIASLSFVLDFDFIDKMVIRKSPSDYEWYSSFSLLVGLVWLYIELIRLLMKIRSNN
jgi:uncharacterized YccA/Bax inhibitor family protein